MWRDVRVCWGGMKRVEQCGGGGESGGRKERINSE